MCLCGWRGEIKVRAACLFRMMGEQWLVDLASIYLFFHFFFINEGRKRAKELSVSFLYGRRAVVSVTVGLRFYFLFYIGT